MQTLIAFLVLIRLIISQSPSWSTDWETEFDYFTYLDSSHKFKLYWTNIDDITIEFGVEAESTGWIALGISPNGQMPGSDIALGWVDDTDGSVYIEDRYATSRSRPVLDNNQNLTVISGEQSNSWTRIRYTRSKYLCDSDDREIVFGTTRLVYALNQNDPTEGDDTTISQHSYKGSQSLNLHSGLSDNIDLTEYDYFDIIMPELEIPSDSDTTYMCYAFNIPDLNGSAQIVGFAPIVQDGNEEHVHHFILSSCAGDDWNEALHSGESAECYTSAANMPDCSDGIYEYSWAIGATELAYPLHAGTPIGEGTPFYYGTLEIHYDNPDFLSGVMDASGVRIYYSHDLREYEAGILKIEYAVVPGSINAQFIPPGIEYAVNSVSCSSECTQDGLPSDGIHIFSSFLHSHTAGTAMRLRHIRDEVELKPIHTDWNYDFNYQQPLIFDSDNEILVLPGDILLLECFYNTSTRTDITRGGFGTTDEMCMVFLNVYPLPDLASCTDLFDVSTMGDWHSAAVEYGYSNDNYEWTVDDDNRFCANLWYRELWESETYSDRIQICSDREDEQIGDYGKTAVLEGVDFTAYSDEDNYYGSCTDIENEAISALTYYNECTDNVDSILNQYLISLIIGFCFVWMS